MKTTCLILLIFCSIVTKAQPDRNEILRPIKNLFDAMKEGDSAKLHRSFSGNVLMGTVSKNKDGKVYIKTDELSAFLKGIGTPHKETYNEMIWGEVVQQDGDFAEVWTNYAFYLGKTFSHCGVDTFQLLKEEGGWKIINLTDTRRKKDCIIPKEISDQFK